MFEHFLKVLGLAGGIVLYILSAVKHSSDDRFVLVQAECAWPSKC